MNHVLVVDSDHSVGQMLKRTLAAEGYRVTIVSSGQLALRALERFRFDVAVVHYELPEVDGLKVLTTVRERQPGCLRMVMSHQAAFPMVAEAVNRGEVLRVIEKPIDGRGFMEHLRAAYASVRRMAQVREAQKRAVSQGERDMLVRMLKDDSLSLALQPIVTHGGETHGFECLLRSDHPVLDGPLAVLRVAEEHDLLHKLGDRVGRLAGAVARQLDPTALLFVNLHPVQLGDLDHLMHGLGPLLSHAHRTVLELTERSRLQSIVGWERSIETLQRAGFRIAVDDLGAGFNSLAVLADLQPAFIKVDMSIVRNLHNEPRKQRLVELLVRFGVATEATVLGEGVEEQAEADALTSLGVELLQGYHFGRPQRWEAPEQEQRLAA